MPYKYDDLKDKIELDGKFIICPIKGFNEKGLNGSIIDKCNPPIRLAQTTFLYKNKKDNFICREKCDDDLFKKISRTGIKRTTRSMNSLNSEDTLTWNVFRSLEKENQLDKMLSKLLGIKLTNVKIYYWAYDMENDCLFEELRKAREEIKEGGTTGTEPDIMISADQCFISIEAKYLSENDLCKEEDVVLLRYETYINYHRLFKLPMSKISKKGTYEKYELARNWMIGDVMRKDKPFYLLNLTLELKEQNIEDIMDNIFIQNEYHKFKRITWEQIYNFCKKENCCLKLRDYMENCPYYKNGVLQRSFNIK